MKETYDKLSALKSKLTTKTYSTSFSLGIQFLSKKYHEPIYNIYGFVRLADEIVDSFHGYNKEKLMKNFRQETVLAINDKISLIPVLNSFQKTVHEYNIDWELIDTFLKSMEMDLKLQRYNRLLYEEYILGSAEVVGLMCLKVFTEGDVDQYNKLKYYAQKLGAAFQKVNFLRDLNQDFFQLGRIYFPETDLSNFSPKDKAKIELEIDKDFKIAMEGIKKLPPGARRGVYLAYVYYRALFKKIRSTPAKKIKSERIRIHNSHKLGLTIKSLIRHQLNFL